MFAFATIFSQDNQWSLPALRHFCRDHGVNLALDIALNVAPSVIPASLCIKAKQRSK